MFTCALIYLVLILDFCTKGFFFHDEALVQHYHDGNDFVGILQVLGGRLKSLRFLCSRVGHLTVSRQDLTFYFFGYGLVFFPSHQNR